MQEVALILSYYKTVGQMPPNSLLGEEGQVLAETAGSTFSGWPGKKTFNLDSNLNC